MNDMLAKTAFSFLGLAVLFASNIAFAETIRVRPEDGYAPFEAAEAGDIIEVEPGTYRFRLFLRARGTASEPIVIRAADPSRRPVWDMSGARAEDLPGSSTRGDRGRGCWQITGAHYQISGMHIRGCSTSSGNSAGIRTIDSESVRVRDVLFEDNEVGFSGTGEDTHVEFCEFVANGVRSSPPQHSMYIFGGTLEVRHNYFHDSRGGQNLHIRARDALIEYNWIARASNYEVDMMTNQDGADAQHMLFRGNVLITDEMPENGGQVFALVNDAGREGLRMSLELIGNTIVVTSGRRPALINVRDGRLAGAEVFLANNVIAGTDTLVRIEADRTVFSGRNNWLERDADDERLEASVLGAEPPFVNRSALDFRPAPGSALVGAADPAYSLIREHASAEGLPIRARRRDSSADIGAFEHNSEGAPFDAYERVEDPPPPVDAGVPMDASVPTDASVPMDAGMNGTRDSGTGADASPVDGAVANTEGEGGCAATTSGEGFALSLLGLLLFRRRQR